MNKKFIAGALAVSIMTMGAGYAAWTQNFTVTNAVNTGQLDFVAELAVVTDSSDYVSATVTDKDANAGDAAMAIKFDTVYPGAELINKITVTDNSTMGVKYVLADNYDAKYCAQTYKIAGLTEGFVTKDELNKKLATIYTAAINKSFVIEIKTVFDAKADEAVLKELTKFDQTITLSASQFNQ